MSMPRDILDSAMSIAIEHVRWARIEGMSPAEILEAYCVPLRQGAAPTWDEVTWAVALAWTHLTRSPERLAA